MSEVSQAGVIAIAAILASKDHYATLGAPRDAPLSDIKKCYVKVSLLVHPDKNPHPHATRAFQKVAGAWSMLNNEETRHRYDMELGDENDCEEVIMTADEAIKMFTSLSRGAGGVRVLGVSEMLLGVNQGGQASNAEASEQLVTGAPGALALSTALIVAGHGVSIAGFPGIGTYASRIGISQILVKGVQIAQDPCARDQIKEGFAEASDYLRSSVLGYVAESLALGHFMEQIGSGISAADQGVSEAATSEGFSRGFSDFKMHCLSLGGHFNCLRFTPSTDSDDDESEAWFKKGLLRAKANQKKFRAKTLVRMVNLQKAVDLEGRLAEVIGYDRKTQRYKVRLVSPVSLTRSSPDSSSASSSSSSPYPIIGDPTPDAKAPDAKAIFKCVRAENLQAVSLLYLGTGPKFAMDFL
eukprot:TRINITY_DN4521_c0_g1_i5.p1 TRINITY_DN4521_c0_g1~~TRINITY_DN4521_c0_g1_i5.p1  ORF type:complete len:412 (-),score=62.81 TRINITY_DN4521_c0_g1_i5:144-1379(-)